MVVDDGSTDDTLKVLEIYKGNAQIKYTIKKTVVNILH